MKLVSHLTALSLLLGCDQPRATGSGGLGIEGATCSRTFDCERPLQCLSGLCAGPVEDSQDASDAATTGDADSYDALPQTEIHETNSDASVDDVTNDVDLETTTDTGLDTLPDISEETVAPDQQCLGTADLAIICSGIQDPADKAGACGTSTACIGLALQSKFNEFEDCTRNCMLDAERPNFRFAVSAGCTECYVDSIRCTAEYCLGSCASNPSSQACTSCRNERGCTSALLTCSGDTDSACTTP